MTTFYIVRHGETAFNKSGKYQGQMDTHLNDEGLAQSQMIGQRMAGIHLDAIYSSDLARARETAAQVAAGRPVTLEPRLREISVGRIMGLMHKEIAEKEPEFWAAFSADMDNIPFPEGESAAQVQARAMEALAEIQALYPNGHVGIVTHGGVIKCIAMAILEMPLSGRGRTVIDNCSLTVVEWGDRGRRVRSLNDTGHLVQAPCDVKADF